jgi:hypothetical protein
MGSVQIHRQQVWDDARDVAGWVHRVEIDAGQRAGLATEERERLKQLERENKELRCDN